MAVSIYPNPAKDIITISYTKIKQVSILDIAGRVVLTKDYQSVDEVKLDVNALGKGMYLVKLLGNSGIVETQRLLVE